MSLETLPSLFGETSGTRDAWLAVRRPEILELFRSAVYGRDPVEPFSWSARVENETKVAHGRKRRVTLTLKSAHGQFDLHLLLFVPDTGPAGRPVFLLIDHRGRSVDALDDSATSEFWPVDEILQRGFATAAFLAWDVDPDEDDGFQHGVHEVLREANPRPVDAWGALAAWGWGASRVLDYLQSQPELDAKRVAVIGHSRGGKAALWAGARDARFAMVISNNSGCGGAALARTTQGETIQNITSSFPYWFCGQYAQFADHEDALPVDQHMLLALIAPRLLYVTSAVGDAWAGPTAEFLSLQLAQPAYQLFGLQGLGEPAASFGVPLLHGDRVGYHLRPGGHGLTEYDWQRICDFAGPRL